MARAGLTAERLAVAGAELADEAGFDHVTVAALARRVGVRAASLYTHIQGSHDLRSRIAALALGELADRASEAIAGRSGRDALAAFAGAYRDYARERPGRYAAARYRVGPDGPAAEAGARHARMTRALLRGYGLAEPDETHAVRMLGGLFHGYAELELAGAFDRTPVASDLSWAWSVESLDVMLRARGSSEPLEL